MLSHSAKPLHLLPQPSTKTLPFSLSLPLNQTPMSTETEDAVRRRTATTDYRKKLLQHKELDSRVRAGQIRNPNQHKALIFFFFLLVSIEFRSDRCSIFFSRVFVLLCYSVIAWYICWLDLCGLD